MKKTNYILIFLLIIISFAVVTFSFWYFKPRKHLNVFILDKTVTDLTYREHAPFVWVLKNKHIVNSKNKLYSKEEDYYGYIPSESNQNQLYKIRSLRLLEVLTLSDNLDMAYYTDSYGVFSNDLVDSAKNKKPYMVYGGLNQNDFLLLRELKRKKKLIIAEFNLLGSPTSTLIREKTQELFDFRWTGWTGRYFKSLKNLPKNELPAWIISAYETTHKQKWNFNNSGVVIVNEDGRIVVLEEGTHLNTGLPAILSTTTAKTEYNLPSVQKYGFWFDIIQTTNKNEIKAFFKLDVKDTGKKVLTDNGLHSTFPAIIEHTSDYKFYYFSGDFSDNMPVEMLAHFSTIPGIMNKIHTGSKGSANEFFWNFYVPLLNGILEKHFYKI